VSAVPASESRNAVTSAECFGRVAVLYGGNSSERAVSLETGRAVLEALLTRGVDAHGWDPAAKGFRDLADAGFDRAWIALHGPGGEDGTLQGALDWIGMPYTGSGVLASALAMDKLRSKHLFAAAGLPTPAFRVVHDHDDARAAAKALGLPLIIKPIGQGSSVGMSKVETPAALPAAIDAALAFGAPVLAEAWISGAELTVGVLQGRALPSIRIETPNVFYDYHAKYESDQTRYHCPGTSSADEEARLGELALRAFREIGCSGWGRVDFMAAPGGEPQVLEINTVPGMTSHSLVPMAAAHAGMDFGELCWRILETSLPAVATAEPERAREVVNGA